VLTDGQATASSAPTVLGGRVLFTQVAPLSLVANTRPPKFPVNALPTT
jgi:hypothetical protein